MSTVTVSCALLSFVLAYVPAFIKNIKAISKAGTAYNQEPRVGLERVLKELPEDEASFLRRALACHNNQMEGAWARGAGGGRVSVVVRGPAARGAPPPPPGPLDHACHHLRGSRC